MGTNINLVGNLGSRAAIKQETCLDFQSSKEIAQTSNDQVSVLRDQVTCLNNIKVT